ncbi:MAG TPA: DUF3471 domain-containing protein, partial [Gammaproteobacteria bacterium]|nr:DUF3471 domain-containing protein [Gammaproteobacteria bacterium]
MSRSAARGHPAPDGPALPGGRTEVQLPAEALLDYAGAYPLAPNVTLTVSVVKGALISRATGQAEVPLYAEAKDKFFARAVDATVEFVRGADGNVNGLIFEARADGVARAEAVKRATARSRTSPSRRRRCRSPRRPRRLRT